MILTRRQKEILDYVADFLGRNGYAPSLEEIGRHFHLSSLATVHKHLKNLEKKGAIARDWNRSRSLRLVSRNAARARFVSLAGEVAAEKGRKLQEGVYAAFAGPTYETPAEVRMARAMGADLVGMSTVPEVIAARYLGMEVLGLSMVTNMAAGILDKPLSHQEVVEAAAKMAPWLSTLLQGILARICK